MLAARIAIGWRVLAMNESSTRAHSAETGACVGVLATLSVETVFIHGKTEAWRRATDARAVWTAA
jgi:hypothetical protein